jgi:hypothetical protein
VKQVAQQEIAPLWLVKMSEKPASPNPYSSPEMKGDNADEPTNRFRWRLIPTVGSAALGLVIFGSLFYLFLTIFLDERLRPKYFAFVMGGVAGSFALLSSLLWWRAKWGPALLTLVGAWLTIWLANSIYAD